MTARTNGHAPVRLRVFDYPDAAQLALTVVDVTWIVLGILAGLALWWWLGGRT